MDDFLVDTDILIDHLRERQEALDLLEAAVDEGTIIYCSTITKIEIYAGIRSGEGDKTRALFEILENINVDDQIALLAGDYLNRFARARGGVYDIEKGAKEIARPLGHRPGAGGAVSFTRELSLGAHLKSLAQNITLGVSPPPDSRTILHRTKIRA